MSLLVCSLLLWWVPRCCFAYGWQIPVLIASSDCTISFSMSLWVACHRVAPFSTAGFESVRWRNYAWTETIRIRFGHVFAFLHLLRYAKIPKLVSPSRVLPAPQIFNSAVAARPARCWRAKMTRFLSLLLPLRRWASYWLTVRISWPMRMKCWCVWTSCWHRITSSA